MRSKIEAVAVSLSLAGMLAGAEPAMAGKKKAAPPKVAPASAQTVRAIGELAGKFRWGMSTDDVTKVVADDIAARYAERLAKESDPARQDALRQEQKADTDKFKKSFVRFDGQTTGWDVSIIDREFAHKNDESMMVIWEKDQRRFLFFWQGRLWKQFVAFDAEHPAFAGKTFDDFANIIQRRYGPAAMTFRKLRTSDEQTLDHLEWPPAGDFALWAIDLTGFYGNFCLSLMQQSKVDEIEKARDVNSPKKDKTGASLVDAALKGQRTADKTNDNADIIDEITGKPAGGDEPARVKPVSTGAGKSGSGKKAVEPEKSEPKTADPLEGTNL